MLQTQTNIKKEKWGCLNDQDIWLFTFYNKNGSSISFSNYGCIVQSLKLRNKTGTFTDVLLGYDSLKDYTIDKYYMCSVVGRCANRIGVGSVAIDGVNCNLSVNGSGFHLHGGLQGFNKKIWNVTEVKSSGITFHYKSRDGEEGYPGNLDVWVNYSFDDDNTWTVEYEAKTDKSTLINLTQHAYFNLEGHDSGSIENQELRINAEKYLPVNKLQMPIGELAYVHSTPFNFLEKKIIGQRINEPDDQLILSKGYDHSWVLEERHTDMLKHAVLLQSQKSGIELNVFTTEPSIHLYTGNYLENAEGKNNSHYYKRSGLCLETQHFPDAPNHKNFPSIILETGKKFRSKTIFQFSIF